VATGSSRLRSSDLAAGITLALLALLVVSQTWQLERSSDMGVGPGYFPLLCAAGLAAIGAALIVRSMLRPDATLYLGGGIRHALVVTASVVAFALLLYPLGMIAAIFVLVVLSTRSAGSITIRSALAIAAAISLACTAVFHFALKLPFPLLPWWL
jgi:hypothetical protein